MTTPRDPTMSHSSLDAVIAAYMQAVEAGEVPNRQDLIEQHPAIADKLRAFFADFDRMDRIASPLRNAAGLDATSDVDGAGPAALPTVRYFGDYELLEVIARGGMGIVYKARQSSLNRIVALKMILRGTFASCATSSASAPRPNQRQTLIILTSCRSTRSVSTTASNTSR